MMRDQNNHPSLVSSNGSFPDAGDRVGLSTVRGGGGRLFSPADYSKAIAAFRSDAAYHEASHGVCALATGLPLRGIFVSDNDGGIWFDDRYREPPVDLADRVAAAPMPPLFESWDSVAIDVVTAHAHVISTVASFEGEMMFCDPAKAVANTQHDIEQARTLAAFVCRSEGSVVAYLAFALAEAHAILDQFSDVVHALAEALIEHRELDRGHIDQILSSSAGSGSK